MAFLSTTTETGKNYITVGHGSAEKIYFFEKSLDSHGKLDFKNFEK
jgi:hypothetical protein